MSPATGPWYLSAKAVRDYAAILARESRSLERPPKGWPAHHLAAIASGSRTQGQWWDRLAVELQRMAEETVASGRQPKRMESGALRYRGPKPLRLGLVVTEGPRPEGDLPQLVRVLPGHGGGHAPRR